MKYMGSKRQMLRNGLGETIERSLTKAHRFVDLFTGSAVVARHVAEKFAVPVLATDLQKFAVVLAQSTLLRDGPLESKSLIDDWMNRASERLTQTPCVKAAFLIQERLITEPISDVSSAARQFSSRSGKGFCVAYGGWYYSPYQALQIDALRQTLPLVKDQAAVALAALISAASRCAASPGHTAQPFNPNTRAGVFVREAWTRDLAEDLRRSFSELSLSFSKVKGDAFVEDAKVFANDLKESDLVFLDPPYSAVHYSRFYHVLESVARGATGPVTGSGRYPSLNERPSSQFSIKTMARAALSSLLKQISEAEAHAILTFPLDEASNGLSGNLIREIAKERFFIEQEKISSRLSTLGGDTVRRNARKDSVELILTLAPRSPNQTHSSKKTSAS